MTVLISKYFAEGMSLVKEFIQTVFLKVTNLFY